MGAGDEDEEVERHGREGARAVALHWFGAGWHRLCGGPDQGNLSSLGRRARQLTDPAVLTPESGASVSKGAVGYGQHPWIGSTSLRGLPRMAGGHRAFPRAGYTGQLSLPSQPDLQCSRRAFGYCDTSCAGLKLPSEYRRSLAPPRLVEEFGDLLGTCAGHEGAKRHQRGDGSSHHRRERGDPVGRRVDLDEVDTVQATATGCRPAIPSRSPAPRPCGAARRSRLRCRPEGRPHPTGRAIPAPRAAAARNSR